MLPKEFLQRIGKSVKALQKMEQNLSLNCWLHRVYRYKKGMKENVKDTSN